MDMSPVRPLTSLACGRGMNRARLKEGMGGAGENGFETLRAQVAEDEAVLGRGVPVAAQAQTASPQLAAGCRWAPYYGAPAAEQRSLFFLCPDAEWQLYLCSDQIG